MELSVARISEIASPKQDESDEIVFSSSPIALIGFSDANRTISEPDIAESLEESVLKAIPYSFGMIGFRGMNDRVFWIWNQGSHIRTSDK